MALNVQFQNLNRANNEILKAFNSQTAAKALEAFQPLNSKERARAKLKALQILKQESESISLADINLSEDALANSLSKADGASLQAMLNLLSSKMIEQNKNTILDFIDNKEAEQKKTVTKVKKDSKKKQKKKEEAKKKPLKKEDNKLAEELIKNIENYLRAVKQKMLKLYDGVLDAISVKRLQSLFEDSIKSIRKYVYEVPVEFIDEKIVNPIYEFPEKLKEQIDLSIEKLTNKKKKKTFSAKEIRGILRSSIDSVREEFNDILEKSIEDLDQNLQDKIKKDQEEKNWKPKVIVNQGVADIKSKLHQG